jgi:hypothetical protein
MPSRTWTWLARPGPGLRPQYGPPAPAPRRTPGMEARLRAWVGLSRLARRPLNGTLPSAPWPGARREWHRPSLRPGQRRSGIIRPSSTTSRLGRASADHNITGGMERAARPAGGPGWHGTHTMGTIVGDDGALTRLALRPAPWIACAGIARYVGPFGCFSSSCAHRPERNNPTRPGSARHQQLVEFRRHQLSPGHPDLYAPASSFSCRPATPAPAARPSPTPASGPK